MKIPLIALTFAVAATAATAQLAAPMTQEAAAPPPEGHRSGHALLHADRERVKGDKERLRLARAAHDGNAIRAAEARLRNDMDAWHADRERLKH